MHQQLMYAGSKFPWLTHSVILDPSLGLELELDLDILKETVHIATCFVKFDILCQQSI